jgi:hypothetical protein
VVHPSGKKEKYRMMPAEIRDGLFSLKEEDFMAVKAV